MRSIVCVAHGTADNFVIEEAPTPKPEAGQVLVRIEAAGASFVDALQAAGKYQFAAAPPYVPGGESAGVIEALGADVAGWSVGDRVLVQSGRGAFATHIVVSPLQLIRLPDGVSADVGASFLQVYGTAWFALKKRTVVRPGEVVLVTGAGGPVSEPALRALRFDGRFLVVGFPGGIASVPLNLVLLNNRTVVGIEWGGWVPRHAEENRAMIGEIVEAIAAGDLRPVTPARRPLDDARAVLTELLDRQAAGKIVLVP